MPINANKESIAHCFNRAAKHYDAACRLQTEVGKHLISLLQPHVVTPEKILDLGAGTGLITQQLAETIGGEKFILTDIAKDMLAVARKRFHKPPHEILHADFEAIPQKENSIDLVFSNMALQWSTTSSTALAEAYRVLRPRGLFALSLPLQGT